MNTLLNYFNEVLVSLDIPPLGKQPKKVDKRPSTKKSESVSLKNIE